MVILELFTDTSCINAVSNLSLGKFIAVSVSCGITCAVVVYAQQASTVGTDHDHGAHVAQVAPVAPVAPVAHVAQVAAVAHVAPVAHVAQSSDHRTSRISLSSPIESRYWRSDFDKSVSGVRLSCVIFVICLFFPKSFSNSFPYIFPISK